MLVIVHVHSLLSSPFRAQNNVNHCYVISKACLQDYHSQHSYTWWSSHCERTVVSFVITRMVFYTCGLILLTWPLAPGSGAPARILAMDTKTFDFVPIYQAHSNQIWYDIRGMKPCQIMLSIWILSCKAAGGQWTPKSSIFLKICQKLPLRFGPNLFCQNCKMIDVFHWDFARHLNPPLLRVCGQFIPKSDISFKTYCQKLAGLKRWNWYGDSVRRWAINLCSPTARVPRKGSCESVH